MPKILKQLWPNKTAEQSRALVKDLTKEPTIRGLEWEINNIKGRLDRIERAIAAKCPSTAWNYPSGSIVIDK